MNLVLFLILVALFVALTPGVLVYLPPKANKLTTALTHGVIFALLWTLLHKPLWQFTSRFEGMTDPVVPPVKKPASPQPGSPQ